MALYRLHINEEETPEDMPGCVCEAGANCNTDHSMVRAKLVIGKSMSSFRRASGRAGVKRWNVAKLQGDCELILVNAKHHGASLRKCLLLQLSHRCMLNMDPNCTRIG